MKVEKYVCDRCGRILNPSSDTNQIGFLVVSKETVVDLCLDCQHEFQTFISACSLSKAIIEGRVILHDGQ